MHNHNNHSSDSTKGKRHITRKRKKPSKIGTAFCFILSGICFVFQLLSNWGNSHYSTTQPYYTSHVSKSSLTILYDIGSWIGSNIGLLFGVLFLILAISDIVVRKNWHKKYPEELPEQQAITYSVNYASDPTNANYIICEICHSRQDAKHTRCDMCGAPFTID